MHDFEIWFPSSDEVSVSIETGLEAGPIQEREVLEIAVFASLAAGVIANLPKGAARELCSALEEFPSPTTDEDIPTTLGQVRLVLPRGERARKGFEGTVTMNGPLPVARWKPRGFRLFGREVQTYSQTAVMAAFLHLLLGLGRPGRNMLVETAHSLGRLGLIGAIGMTSHSRAAVAALEQGAEAAGAAGPSDE
jgi:hypothetical protein